MLLTIAECRLSCLKLRSSFKVMGGGRMGGCFPLTRGWLTTLRLGGQCCRYKDAECSSCNPDLLHRVLHLDTSHSQWSSPPCLLASCSPRLLWQLRLLPSSLALLVVRPGPCSVLLAAKQTLPMCSTALTGLVLSGIPTPLFVRFIELWI